jgi:hypothetical protein
MTERKPSQYLLTHLLLSLIYSLEVSCGLSKRPTPSSYFIKLSSALPFLCANFGVMQIRGIGELVVKIHIESTRGYGYNRAIA